MSRVLQEMTGSRIRVSPDPLLLPSAHARIVWCIDDASIMMTPTRSPKWTRALNPWRSLASRFRAPKLLLSPRSGSNQRVPRPWIRCPALGQQEEDATAVFTVLMGQEVLNEGS